MSSTHFLLSSLSLSLGLGLFRHSLPAVLRLMLMLMLLLCLDVLVQPGLKFSLSGLDRAVSVGLDGVDLRQHLEPDVVGMVVVVVRHMGEDGGHGGVAALDDGCEERVG